MVTVLGYYKIDDTEQRVQYNFDAFLSYLAIKAKTQLPHFEVDLKHDKEHLYDLGVKRTTNVSNFK